MGEPLWNFSIAVYGAPQVEGECLKAQDRFGLDVNLLLLCAYIGAMHGVALTADDIAAARREAGAWHEDIIKPLRAARRTLKTIDWGENAPPAAAASELRTQVKAAELEAERIEQAMLERWAETRLAGRPRGEPRDAVLANLQTLLADYGVGPERLAAADALQHLIAAALARAAANPTPPR
ncbi:MAG: TIGR02444 family protein [Pseudolabrys sp.]